MTDTYKLLQDERDALSASSQDEGPKKPLPQLSQHQRLHAEHNLDETIVEQKYPIEECSWGDEKYSFPNQIGAIKKVYRYLTGSEKNMKSFLKALNALPNVQYYVKTDTGRQKLYQIEVLFKFFQEQTQTGSIIKKRKITSWDELVFRMEQMED